MNDQDFRALIQQLISERVRPNTEPRNTVGAPVAAMVTHPSQAIYLSVVNVGDACVIQPDVACDHCGYCKCHGH